MNALQHSPVELIHYIRCSLNWESTTYSRIYSKTTRTIFATKRWKFNTQVWQDRPEAEIFQGVSFLFWQAITHTLPLQGQRSFSKRNMRKAQQPADLAQRQSFPESRVLSQGITRPNKRKLVLKAAARGYQKVFIDPRSLQSDAELRDPPSAALFSRALMSPFQVSKVP